MSLENFMSEYKEKSKDQIVDELFPKDRYEPIPTGNYTATVTNVTEDEEKNTVTFEYTISEGQYEKRKVFSSMNYAHPVGKEILLKTLVKLEVFNNTKSFRSMLQDAMALECDIYIKSAPSKNDPTKTYSNAYINNVIKQAPLTQKPFANLPNMAPNAKQRQEQSAPPKFNSGDEIPF